MDKLKQHIDESLSDVVFGASEKAEVLNRIAKEEIIMKKKLPAAALICGLVLVLSLTALAIAGRSMGILDFAGRYSGVSIPEDAEEFIDTRADILYEDEYFTLTLGEVYYDGGSLYCTCEVSAKAEDTFLMAFDATPYDYYDYDTNTKLCDRYTSGSYSRMVRVDFYPDFALFDNGGLDWAYSDDVLVLYFYCNNTSGAELSEIPFSLDRWVYADIFALEDGAECIDYASGEVSVAVEIPAELRSYVCAVSCDYPSIGIRVDRVEITAAPLELEYRIYYSITDEELYSALDGGLFFEFISPDSAEESPYLQRLASGISANSSIGPREDGRYSQTGTLAKSELTDVYYIRAYSFILDGKPRYETGVFEVEEVK